jgi:hypothetical protein
MAEQLIQDSTNERPKRWRCPLCRKDTGCRVKCTEGYFTEGYCLSWKLAWKVNDDGKTINIDGYVIESSKCVKKAGKLVLSFIFAEEITQAGNKPKLAEMR